MIWYRQLLYYFPCYVVENEKKIDDVVLTWNKIIIF